MLSSVILFSELIHRPDCSTPTEQALLDFIDGGWAVAEVYHVTLKPAETIKQSLVAMIKARGFDNIRVTIAHGRVYLVKTDEAVDMAERYETAAEEWRQKAIILLLSAELRYATQMDKLRSGR